MNYETIIYEVKNNVCLIKINCPEVRNAISDLHLVEMQDAFLTAEQDDQVKAIVFTGEGKAFCAGSNLNKYSGSNKNAERNVIDSLKIVKNGQKLLNVMMNLEKPIIGAINGAAAGAGFSLALACDLVIASDSAFFVQTFATIVGVLPDLGSMHFLTQVLGTYRAKELMFLGERITAEKAYQFGFVNEVVEGQLLLDRAFAVATKIANGPSVPIKFIKQLVNQDAHFNLPEFLQSEAFAQSICFQTEDFKEGVASFMEKRPAQFKGR